MKPVIALWVLVTCLPLCALAEDTALPQASPPAGIPVKLTPAQIVEKNLAARGGVEAWQKVQTMVWMGHVEGSNTPASKLPFVLGMKRPNKTRFEITAVYQKSLRIYDGKDGWKVRPASSGVPETHPFSPEELQYAHDTQVIDGPLMDAAAKGLPIQLEGEQELEGRKAYRLVVRSGPGASQRIWVDAETFLELKYERPGRNASGAPSLVPIYLREYQSFEGLQLPTLIETGSGRGDNPAADKMVIEKIALNAKLGDEMFTKPQSAGQKRKRVVVDTRNSAPASPGVSSAPKASAQP